MILTYSKDIFVPGIKDGLKIHTLREDPNKRWKPGMSIQHWRGNPRNVRQHPYKFADGECKAVEEVMIFRDNARVFQMDVLVAHWTDDHTRQIGERWLTDDEIQLLATNDLLGVAAFRRWFLPSGEPCWKGRIIHFTDFLYCPPNPKSEIVNPKS